MDYRARAHNLPTTTRQSTHLRLHHARQSFEPGAEEKYAAVVFFLDGVLGPVPETIVCVVFRPTDATTGSWPRNGFRGRTCVSRQSFPCWAGQRSAFTGDHDFLCENRCSCDSPQWYSPYWMPGTGPRKRVFPYAGGWCSSHRTPDSEFTRGCCRKIRKFSVPTFSRTSVEALYVAVQLGLERTVKCPASRAGDIPNWNGGNGVKGHALRLLKPTDPIGVPPLQRPTAFICPSDPPGQSTVVSHAHITLP